MERCEQCGFVYGDHPTNGVVAELAQLGPSYRSRLEPPDGNASRAGGSWDAVLRQRPRPEVWSALEYACHLRDVVLAQRERLYLALVEDRPSFAPIYRDQRVALARYGSEHPGRVADAIEVALALICRGFDGLDAGQWSRTCVYNFPAPREQTMVWLAQHTLHEGHHHLGDIDEVVAQVTAGGPGTPRPG